MSTRHGHDRPNFLVLLPDQHRYDWLGANPALPLRTPNLEQLGARGVRFTRAITPSPLCAPARACLASGRAYERCGVPNNKFDYPLDQPTYYQALRGAGYQVAGVGKFDLHKATLDWGLDGSRLLDEWGFTEGIDNEGKMDAIASAAGRAAAASGNSALGGGDAVASAAGRVAAAPEERPALTPTGPYTAYLQSRGLLQAHVDDFRQRRANAGLHPTPLPDDAYCDNWIAENGLRFLEGFPPDQPWHLVVNFTGPHSPMDVTESMRRAWEGVPFPPPVSNTQPEVDHQTVRQNYAAMIENIDRQAGRLIEAVRARGELDRTLIVYSSDHGEMLGDHSRWGKSIYYQPSVGIPLIVAGPVVRSGLVSDALVSLHDLTATFLEYAGCAPLPEMDSRSLRPVLAGERSSHREIVCSGLDAWRMVFDGRYKLVEDDQAGTLLFDLQEDPAELRNLADTHPAEVERLATRLTAAPRT
jgi:arylsulfatase A-like enzyme